MSAIEFRTLGTLDLRAADGRELHSLLAQPKRIALLAYLCAARPRGFHRRETLLGLFWPNADAEHARTSLRKSIHVLRKALGDDAIVSRGDEEIAVDFSRIACDAVQFDESVRTNRNEDALSLYGGDFLNGMFVDETPEFDRWVESERSRLRHAAADAALLCAEGLHGAKDLKAALSYVRRSLELNPTDERALRLLLLLQSESGDRAGAISAYEEFASNLAAEFQTVPAAETRQTVELIRRPDDYGPGVGAPSRIGAAAIAPSPRWGRQLNPIAATESAVQHGRNWRAAVVPIVAIPLALLVIDWSIRDNRPRQVLRYTLNVDSSEAVTPGPAWSGRLAISPDGAVLAYIGGARGQLMIRARDELHARPVPGTEDANTPFFSPDGQRVGFLREEQVVVVPVRDGLPVTLSESRTGVGGASWGTDGFIYADGRNRAGLLRVRDSGGAPPEPFTTLDTASGEIDHLWPDALPSGKGVVFTIRSVARGTRPIAPTFAVAVAETPSGRHRILLKDAVFARYARPGYLVYANTTRMLMMIPFDQRSLQITGSPKSVIADLRVSSFGLADVALSSTGTLLYATGPDRAEKELVWITREGKVEPVAPNWHGDFYGAVDVSRDGKSIAFVMRPGGVVADVWIKRLDEAPKKLTLEGLSNLVPGWTPDGEAVTYTAMAPNRTFKMWTQPIDGRNSPTLSYASSNNGIFGPRWSADKRWLVFTRGPGSNGSFDIVGLRPGIDTVAVPLLTEKYNERNPSLSSDSRWMAYDSDESGRPEINVVPFPDTHSARWVVTSTGGRLPLWSRDGRELFYRDSAGRIMGVQLRSKPAFSAGEPKPIFEAPFASFDGDQIYAVAPDGRFLMIRNVAADVRDKLVVVENWFDELTAANKGGSR